MFASIKPTTSTMAFTPSLYPSGACLFAHSLQFLQLNDVRYPSSDI
jgi:hypothetical protein